MERFKLYREHWFITSAGAAIWCLIFYVLLTDKYVILEYMFWFFLTCGVLCFILGIFWCKSAQPFEDDIKKIWEEKSK